MKLNNLTIAVLIALGTAACGGSDDATTPPHVDPTPTPTPQAVLSKVKTTARRMPVDIARPPNGVMTALHPQTQAITIAMMRHSDIPMTRPYKPPVDQPVGQEKAIWWIGMAKE